MKQEILEIAANQMKAGGYEALSFRKISEDLSISKANVHHHFKNKESLALEATKEYTEANFKNFEMMAKQFHGDLLGFVTATEAFFWTGSKEAGHCGICVCDQVMRDTNSPESLRKMAEEHFQLFSNLVFEVVQSAIENKQLKEGLEVETVAMQTAMMMTGMRNMAQNMHSVEEAEKVLGGQLARWVKSISN
jgi:TetR/AcrR family transcriptional repressor of nem operon